MSYDEEAWRKDTFVQGVSQMGSLCFGNMPNEFHVHAAGFEISYC
jgi:hypothetical protein